MKIPNKMGMNILLAIAFAVFAAPALLHAQTDEIQVYDAAIAAPGIFNLTWHNNFIASGSQIPSFPGALIPDHAFNGVTEWAYGMTPWWEMGLYLPLYSISEHRGATINGGKLRFLFVSPHADDRKFFYGANFEFSYNAKHWNPNTYSSEIRPILGLHLHPFDFIVNPILDNEWKGGFANLDFAPAERLAYNFPNKWTLALEEYADYGHLEHWQSAGNQVHVLWGVFDHSTKFVDIEGGVGFGLTSVSDKVTLKLILSRDLNTTPRKIL